MSTVWHYILIFLGVAIEGPIVTLTAAALAGNGLLNPLIVFLAAGLGNVTGDLGWYLLGYFGGFESRLRSWPRFARFEPQIEQIKVDMAQRAPRLLLASKLSLGIGSIPALIAAGIVRVPWWRVVAVQVVGEIIWTGGLLLLGFFLGQYIPQIMRDLRIATIVGSVLLLLLVGWLLRDQIGTVIKNKN